METFKPALTPSPTVQRIICHFLSWFNNNTHFRERVGGLYGTSFQKEGDSLLGNQETKTFYCMNNEINDAVVHIHILSFITWYA
jgi:hypothetical protein